MNQEDEPLVERALSRRSSFVSRRILLNEDDSKLHEKLSFKLHPELIRFVAYVFFWAMAILAIILANTMVSPLLAAGSPDGSSCGPFNGGTLVDGTVIPPGEGFDLATESHLIRAFGFNNICANWDYSPSREITGAFYPLFEYTLQLFIVADYINIAVHHKKGLISTRYYRAFKFLFPIMLICTALFRLIFINIAYENVQMHTLGFLLLQVMLILVSFLDAFYIIEAKLEYSIFCGRTYAVIVTYLVLNTIISAIKLYTTFSVVVGNDMPVWAKTSLTGEYGGIVPGRIVDLIWMFFNALIPPLMALIRWRLEKPLEVVIDVQPLPHLVPGSDDPETDPETEVKSS